MDDPDMMQELLKQFRRFLGEDPIQTSVVDVTALQLVEVTRKKYGVRFTNASVTKPKNHQKEVNTLSKKN